MYIESFLEGEFLPGVLSLDTCVQRCRQKKLAYWVCVDKKPPEYYTSDESA